MAGATPSGRPTAGLAAAAAVVLMVAGAAVYTGWWLATPGDCTALLPATGGWRAEGVRPELRGPCAALRDGDVIVAAAPDPGGIAYRVLRDGVAVQAVEPQGPPRLGAALAASWSFVVFTVALAAVAGYAFSRRRRDPAVPPLLVVAGALLASSTVTLLGLPASAMGSGWLWLYLGCVQVVYTVAWSAMLSFAVQFRGPAAGPARRAGCYAVPLAVLGAGALLVPGDLGSTGWVGGLIVVQSAVTVALIVAAVSVSARRFRGAGGDPVVRQQLRVLAAGAWTSSALVLAGWLVPGLLTGAPLLPAGWIGLPGLTTVAALAVAMLRYRLFDLDAVVTRSIVYAALTAAVVSLYLGVVTLLAAVLDTTATGPVAVAGAAAVALAVNPLRVGLQGAVNRMLYGDRDAPYAALHRLGRRLAATSEPAGLLPAAAEDVARALRLPFVAVDLALDGETVRMATSGTPPPGAVLHAEPLVHQGETLGALVVAPRAPGERPGPADRRLLADLADQVGAAAQVVRLDVDLRRSREQLVLAREEERRALRRALHDELGPSVAALALRAETARRMLVADGVAEEADVLAELGGLRRDATAAAADLRRLAYDLRPPALDELGLVGALRERAERMGPGGPETVVDAPAGLPQLPAAVEVAAFRIAAEAMANAARHSAARCCTVQLGCAGDELRLAVIDDGAGRPEAFRAGVGITAMRERAHELRGGCTVGPGKAGGTVVTAWLPLPAAGAPS
ncbi:ATP-binding protein [Pseudonocardia saturnea]